MNKMNHLCDYLIAEISCIWISKCNNLFVFCSPAILIKSVCLHYMQPVDIKCVFSIFMASFIYINRKVELHTDLHNGISMLKRSNGYVA